jgi:MFS family permease
MWAAAWIVTAIFILSNSATPLYVRWQTAFGFSSATLTAIFAAYILGLLLTLLVAGQFADRFGRRSVLLPGLGAAIVACLLFAGAQSVAMLLVARCLSGVAVGTAVTAGMASIVDLGGPQRKRQASQLASVSMVLGAGLGPLLAGGLALGLSEPIIPIYAAEFVILASATLIALRLPLRKGGRPGGGIWRLRLPGVPRVNRRHLALGIAVFGPGITATSFVLSLGPSVLSRLTGVTNPLTAGAMACAMFLTATAVQFLARSLSIRTVFLLGALSTVLSMAGIGIAISTSGAIVLVVAALLAGAGQGLGQLGGLTLIGLHVPGERRAEANAVLNIGGYVPAGLMPMATGFVIDRGSLATGAGAFALTLAIVAVAGGAFVAQSFRDAKGRN